MGMNVPVLFPLITHNSQIHLQRQSSTQQGQSGQVPARALSLSRSVPLGTFALKKRPSEVS